MMMVILEAKDSSDGMFDSHTHISCPKITVLKNDGDDDEVLNSSLLFSSTPFNSSFGMFQMPKGVNLIKTGPQAL